MCLRYTLTFGEATYFVRLACVRHAASVRPEPGSNSRLISVLKLTLAFCSDLRVKKFSLENFKSTHTLATTLVMSQTELLFFALLITTFVIIH